MKIYNLCSRPGGCCATMQKQEDGNWLIRDDFGGFVKLTPKEIAIMYSHSSKEDKP